MIIILIIIIILIMIICYIYRALSLKKSQSALHEKRHVWNKRLIHNNQMYKNEGL